jgi:hypothetical protein
MWIPVCPNSFRTRVAADRIRKAESAVIAKARITSDIFTGVFALPISTITVEIAPGPANRPRG